MAVYVPLRGSRCERCDGAVAYHVKRDGTVAKVYVACVGDCDWDHRAGTFDFGGIGGPDELDEQAKSVARNHVLSMGASA